MKKALPRPSMLFLTRAKLYLAFDAKDEKSIRNLSRKIDEWQKLLLESPAAEIAG